MPKDRANIFKLEKIILEEYKNKEFTDCMPGAEDFAKCLKETILTKETPYVLRLEDKFGMGKTHFSTRFAYFLQNCNIDAIYFSAWENDYIEQPFISFSTEIIKYFQQKSTFEKLKADFGNVSKSIYLLIINLLKSSTISVTAAVGIQAGCSFDLNKGIEAIEKFIKSFVENEDYLINFKKKLKSFIESLPNKRLVLIVDELDRCRPDYAMKTLEIIKHFFDIEGLFIIIPTNEHSLQKCVKSLYGLDEGSYEDAGNEYYFTKFFNDKLNLYKPNYLKLVQTVITKEKIISLIESNKMTLKDRYNSLETLHQKLAEFGEGFKLTMREMLSVCNKAIYFCHYISKKIDCEYMAYLLCNNASRIKNTNCKIQISHPFSTNSLKKTLLEFVVPKEVYKINNTLYEQQFMREYQIFQNRSFSSYKEFDELYKTYSEKPKDFSAYSNEDIRDMHSSLKYNFSLLEGYMERKKRIIDNYKYFWDSDDKDSELQEYYDKVINNEILLHSNNVEPIEVEA